MIERMSMTCEEAGKKRWVGVTKAQRSAHGRMMQKHVKRPAGGRPRGKTATAKDKPGAKGIDVGKAKKRAVKKKLKKTA